MKLGTYDDLGILPASVVTAAAAAVLRDHVQGDESVRMGVGWGGGKLSKKWQRTCMCWVGWE